jgi:hypothetical protein
MFPDSPQLPYAFKIYRSQGKVAMFMALNGSLRAIIGVTDVVRLEAAFVVGALQQQGIPCYMITGDEDATALVSHIRISEYKTAICNMCQRIHQHVRASSSYMYPLLIYILTPPLSLPVSTLLVY